MALDQKLLDELTLLARFPRHSLHQGIKIHSSAPEGVQGAAVRLFEKGVIDSPDGGYLTDLGHDLIGHFDHVYSALK
ncbi:MULTISPECIES: TIGR02647 family protein [Pseudoalteromonas]|uniref:TIGR02647 family protein n=1 Tax=Pseudoalteromonas TaxID=53246 RepID=UPI000FFEF306|nr:MULTISPECIES: TIGR02647 family protein [Pseudoalteromonas]MCG9760839.1 TIGR02647 family protein [Pseudoalteromonas sp. Isolate6]NKC20741.1 TIGR02647 family protein [Pseudoalteromonas galatheae]RXE87068.1 TIGR02647 family protein [Pseudoalteromonas sp. A757]